MRDLRLFLGALFDELVHIAPLVVWTAEDYFSLAVEDQSMTCRPRCSPNQAQSLSQAIAKVRHSGPDPSLLALGHLPTPNVVMIFHSNSVLLVHRSSMHPAHVRGRRILRVCGHILAWCLEICCGAHGVLERHKSYGAH